MAKFVSDDNLRQFKNNLDETYAGQTGNYPNLIAGKATESNGNLFYNGDFRLNTLGQTEYVDNSNEYFDCVDGWEFGYGDCTLEVLPAGGVQITKESGETNPTNFHTVDIRDAISHAGEYTVSFKVDSLSSVQQVYGYYIPQGSSAVYLTMTAKNDAENNIAIRTFTLTEEQVSAIRQSTRLVIGIQKTASVESMVIYWAKLEEGETSTAPNGIANNATKSLYAEKAAEAERAARADMLGTTQQIRATSGQLGWWKIGEVDINNLPTSYSSYSLIMLVNGIHESQFASDNQAESGIVELDVRKDSGALVSNNCGVSILSGNLNSSDFCIVANGTTVALYANIPNVYGTVDFVVINETAENNPGNRYFVFEAAFSAASAPGGAVYAVNRNNAEYDGDGNDIAATYATKEELTVIEDTYASQTQISNPNLLINPDFKINQRGKTTYTGNTYTVDRWVSESGSQASVNVVSTGLRLNSTTSTPLYLYQYIEQDLELSTNYVLTLSGGLTASGTRAKYTAGFTTPSTKPTSATVIYSQTISIAHITISVGYDASKGYYVRINVLNDAANTLYLDWVKLEKGSVSTMFVPPDTTTELLKCQRYYRIIKQNWYPCVGGTGSDQFSISLQLNPPMRTASTLESASTGGWIRFGGSTRTVTTSNFTLSDNFADRCRFVGSISPSISGFGSDIGFISSFDIALDAEI